MLIGADPSQPLVVVRVTGFPAEQEQGLDNTWTTTPSSDVFKKPGEREHAMISSSVPIFKSPESQSIVVIFARKGKAPVLQAPRSTSLSSYVLQLLSKATRQANASTRVLTSPVQNTQ
ncbi:hypothetical protein Q7P35_001987 [Cladosporium inversicolor]